MPLPTRSALADVPRPRTLALAAVLLGALAGCSSDAPAPPTAPSERIAGAPGRLRHPTTRTSLAGLDGATPTPLDFATYDGSHEVVHPDVVGFPTPWKGHRYWGAITPYPNSNRDFENPSLFASEDGSAWEIPAGVTNPIARTTRGHLSDPDVVFDARHGALWLYYREAIFDKGRHVEDNVTRLTSTDGVHWRDRRVVYTVRGRYVVSPSVARGPDGWRMWAVDAGSVGCSSPANRILLRRSTDGVKWTGPVPVAFDQPGYVPWHLDVQYLPSRRAYWALIAAYPRAMGCAATDLFLATSATGDRWTTYPSPVFARGVIEAFETNVYRSSLLYDAATDVATIWLTGARVAPWIEGDAPLFRWSAAVVQLGADALLARASAPPAAPRLAPDAALMRTISARSVLP